VPQRSFVHLVVDRANGSITARRSYSLNGALPSTVHPSASEYTA